MLSHSSSLHFKFTGSFVAWFYFVFQKCCCHLCYFYLHKCLEWRKIPCQLPDLGRINWINECMSCLWCFPRADGERLTVETK